MLIEIHMIQNHSPANLNRDDLGAPKTCYFGGVLRSRISSQCLKRSIRTSEHFKGLCGGIRTRQLAKLIADRVDGSVEVKKRAAKILEKCGIAPKDDNKSDMLIYTTDDAISQLAALLQANHGEGPELVEQCGTLISTLTAVPDMALAGRMLETGVLADTTVEASLQVAHAISTHEARPEVDYYVAADDIPDKDAGAGFVDEALFASACFYKYFSIHWEQLLGNLSGFQGNREHLAAHTVGAFIQGAALTNPSGKQNSFAAHNPPEGVIVDLKKHGGTPISYANAFAAPVSGKGSPDLVSQSVAQLAQYVHDLDVGYKKAPTHTRLWFSPNLRHQLNYTEANKQHACADRQLKSLDDLLTAAIGELGFDWHAVQSVVTKQ